MPWNTIQHQQRRKRQRPAQYPLGAFCAAYAAAMTAVAVATHLGSDVGVMVYVLAGGLISRFVSQRVVWHEYESSLYDIVVAKLRMAAFWPVVMPLLVLQIAIDRYL